MINRKSYLDQIDPFIGAPVIKVITGIRRSGKSVLLEQLQDRLKQKGVDESQIITLNLESAQGMTIRDASDLIAVISGMVNTSDKKVYIFLDEIQEVDEWEKAVNSFRVDYDSDIYITGSNSNLLSGELSTHLSGRYVEVKVYPFSFAEFLQSITETIGISDINIAFQRYLILGGMPFLHYLNFEVDASKQYLLDVYNSVMVKDVVKRNNIRDVDLLERVSLYVMANIGNAFSARSLSAYFKNESRVVATETILNYLAACVNACLFHPVRRQDAIGKRILQVEEKYYLADHGVRQALYGNNTRDIQAVLENIVYIELLRRGYKVTVGKIKDYEIDFIAEKASKKIYIQVAYLITDETTLNRELRPLLLVEDNYPKFILSLDPIDRSAEGVRHVNIQNFLLNPIII